jgi:hypothetical protein
MRRVRRLPKAWQALHAPLASTKRLGLQSLGARLTASHAQHRRDRALTLPNARRQARSTPLTHLP